MNLKATEVDVLGKRLVDQCCIDLTIRGFSSDSGNRLNTLWAPLICDLCHISNLGVGCLSSERIEDNRSSALNVSIVYKVLSKCD